MARRRGVLAFNCLLRVSGKPQKADVSLRYPPKDASRHFCHKKFDMSLTIRTWLHITCHYSAPSTVSTAAAPNQPLARHNHERIQPRGFRRNLQSWREASTRGTFSCSYGHMAVVRTERECCRKTVHQQISAVLCPVYGLGL